MNQHQTTDAKNAGITNNPATLEELTQPLLECLQSQYPTGELALF